MTPGRPKGGELSERDTASQRVASPSGSPGRIFVTASMNTPAASTSDASGGEADEIDDLTLVRRAQQGDRGAFKSLFERYHRRVYAVALAVLKSPPDAHDVVQEAFVKVHRHLADFQGVSSFYTWLYRICMNLSIDQLRRRKSGRHVEYDDSAEASQSSSLLASGDPARTHSRKELAAKMQEALATLPEYHQQVILLREIEGLSYDEIAKIMQVPKGTIMSRLFHARRKMQSALAEYVDGELESHDEDDDAS